MHCKNAVLITSFVSLKSYFPTIKVMISEYSENNLPFFWWKSKWSFILIDSSAENIPILAYFKIQTLEKMFNIFIGIIIIYI